MPPPTSITPAKAPQTLKASLFPLPCSLIFAKSLIRRAGTDFYRGHLVLVMTDFSAHGTTGKLSRIFAGPKKQDRPRRSFRSARGPHGLFAKVPVLVYRLSIRMLRGIQPTIRLSGVSNFGIKTTSLPAGYPWAVQACRGSTARRSQFGLSGGVIPRSSAVAPKPSEALIRCLRRLANRPSATKSIRGCSASDDRPTVPPLFPNVNKKP